MHKLMTAILISAALLLAGQGSNPAAKQLQSAINKEVVEGDLKGAIEQYRKIATQFAKQPEIAAKALLQMGQCQEKLGQAEARKSYERIVRDYSGAREYANAARARLAALAGQDDARGVMAQQLAKARCQRVSWDGTMCPFIDEEGQVSLRELPGGATKRLTKSASKRGRADIPALSRDGKQVAFAWLPDWDDPYYPPPREQELRVIRTDGTAERTVPLKIKYGDSVFPLDWFPDGKKILAKVSQKGYWGLAAVDVATGELRHLRNFAAEQVQNFARATVAPDGRWVTYDKLHGDWNIYAMNAETGEESPVVTGPGWDSDPEWTPDGGKIVFRSDREGSEAIWMINVANGKSVGTPVVLRRAAGKITLRGISRDGSVYYIQSNRSSDVYAVKVNPQTLRAESAPARQIDTYVGHNGVPWWAPSGELFAYLSERDAKWRLVFHHSDGKEVVVTEPVLAWPFTPQWCGNGDRLAMFGMGMNYKRLKVYDARTGDAPQPEAEITGLQPAFQWGAAPDCKSVYVSHYSSQAKQRRIYRYDVATGKETDLVRDGGTWARFPAASPDGQWLAMTGSLEGGKESGVLVVSTSGGALRLLAPGYDLGYSWTPDSKRLIFARQGELYWVPLEGGEPKAMGVRMPGVGFPTLNPDGTRLLFSATEASNELWVVRNLPLN